MAINYTNLFTALGQVVRKTDSYDDFIDNVATYKTETLTTMGAQSVPHLQDDVPETYEELQDIVSAWITTRLKDRSDKILTHGTLVTDELDIGDVVGPQEVLPLLYDDMVTNAQDVLESAITIGSVTYTVANSGAMVLVTTSTLDGVNAPASYALASDRYAGITSQLAQTSQTIAVTCTADSESGGKTRGQEDFQVVGGSAMGPYQKDSEGLGETTLVVGNEAGRNMVLNSGFEDWTTNVPDNWTVNTGTGGTDFDEDAVGLRGTSSFRIKNGVRTFNVSQLIATTDLERRRGYLLVALVKKSGTTGVATITLKESAATKATLSINMATASSGWNVYSDVFIVPDEIAVDWTLAIDVAASTYDGDPLIDDLVIIPLTYFGGIGTALIAVDEKILLGDKAEFTLSNDNAGKFQTYLRRAYGFQIPTDAVPSIADSLAIEP